MLWLPSFLLASADLGDTTDVSAGLGGDATANNTNLGLLFDTFVPLSSILTIFIAVGFTLPRHEWFGLFWLVWWIFAVYVSLLSVDDDNNIISNGEGMFPSSSTKDRMLGVIVLLGVPVVMWLVLWTWWKKEAPLSSSSRQRHHRWGPLRTILPKISPIRGFVLKHVPLWSMVAIHIYRLDGLSILVPFWNGEVPNFVGYQTILLDVIMGITAVPLTYLLYVPSRPSATTTTARAMRVGSRRAKRTLPPKFLKDALWFWNSIGLYDLSSAYLVFVLNACGWGGPHITQPPLLPRLGRHPFPLLLLFQVPLAIVVHILMLTHSEELAKAHEQQLQNSRDLGLILPTTAAALNRG
jgi:hypothetical protein